MIETRAQHNSVAHPNLMVSAIDRARRALVSLLNALAGTFGVVIQLSVHLLRAPILLEISADPARNSRIAVPKVP